MAKIHEEVVQIKLNKLVKDKEKVDSIVTTEFIESLVQVVEQLVPEGIIAEVETKK
jgi:hypothetical protein